MQKVLRCWKAKFSKEIPLTHNRESPTCQPAAGVTAALTCERTTQPADMDFSGTWKVYSEENLEEFLKVIGAPEIIVKMRKDVKPVMVIEQNGMDFTCTMKTPFCTRVNHFSIGKESEICSLDGRKLKCTVREENGKLICETNKFTSVREIQGDEMIEMATAGTVTFISRSKRA
ncbi:fatty acid-binding protein 10-A, liver basic-like [Cyprinodon tularosa]|uniref:fatty acid-binding protein 10-A, liver basic-like n=1 Tax=Cyprinodon variegatus TaxID=28743 RepID=UPI000742699B|nr:PREDICTED: fatty acid-binding protein 10-A, liver basic-like [Cyprinodon variegatus]XP_038151985.1 fatty acid-binding protein 10-A, liver basic-like [Cyprinodon tularosa]